MQRRLAAILAADVVGYSRLIGADESGTLAMLRALLKELVQPTLKRHRGRVVKLMGDGLLAEFGSVVDAVAAAVEIQEVMPERSAHLSEDRRIALRIGVNMGDVAVEDGDLFGDGVNIAARLQEIADPNGVAISDDAYRQLSGRLDLPFKDAGEKVLKNINQPVRIWLWPSVNTQSSGTLGGLPDKASIAILPFDNMSGDPEQEYFADGITEDIITALSNIRTYTVLARNSTFTYKGKSVDAKEVGRTLNVHYMLEGSVRRAGNRVRVTAQLIDTTTGDHIWANRYDGTLDDIFDLQDRITSTIVGTIEPELVRAEGGRLKEKRPDNMDAYDYLLRGLALMHKLTPEDTREALVCFEKSIERDPKYGRAYAYASWCYRRDISQSGLTLSIEDRQKAVALARESLRIDRDDPFVLVYAALTIGFIERDFDEALALVERAILLNSVSHRFWNSKAQMHSLKGDTVAAIEAAERAIGLSPNDPAIWVSYWCIAEAHLQERRYEEATKFAKQALRHNENFAPARHIIAAASAQLGRDTEARQALRAALEINPELTISNFPKLYPVALLKNLDAFLDGLRKAGLSE